MISYDEFYKIIKPLVIKFGVPQGGEEALKIDYDTLKIFQADDLRQAVSDILTEHQFNSYPQLHVFIDKLNDILSAKEKPENHEEKCLGCLNSGIYFNPITETARFCDCEIGQRKREFFFVYKRTRNLKEAEKRAAELEVKKIKIKPIYEKQFHDGKFVGYEHTEEVHEAIIQKLKNLIERRREK